VTWSNLADWWRGEIEHDHAYDEVVTPLLTELLEPRNGRRYLDLGCGEGRVMRAVETAGGVAHGVDLNHDLVTGLNNAVVAQLPEIPMRTGAYDGIYCVLTLEHIQDHQYLFAEAARVVKGEGVMVLVMNHPTWTAPGSTPITDYDAEILWRPGSYFTTGATSIPAGNGEVTFYHRPLSEILTSAAASGWMLVRMVEQPHHDLEDQAGIPRLLGCRWERTG
jgi:SAM-dependent methyltransferase